MRFWLFVLGALVAGIGWIGMYVGLSYFLGAEVAKRIGNAGAKAVARGARDRRHRAGNQGRLRPGGARPSKQADVSRMRPEITRPSPKTRRYPQITGSSPDRRPWARC